MDLELATGLLGALPELGGLSGLVVLVVILLRWQGQTATRHGEEMDRMARLHDAESGEWREENSRLRAQRDEAEARLREMYGLPASHPPVGAPPGATSPGPIPGSSRPGRRRREP